VNSNTVAKEKFMKTMTVGELKTNFSNALDSVRAGKTIVVCYGRNHDKVAAMVPYADIAPTHKRKLGLLKGKARVKFARDFKLDDESLLSA
jgi:antitoxin (DNA-binding transcriptional repressor) of toxin-antitoxin stability system